jgi:hypothetical protein
MSEQEDQERAARVMEVFGDCMRELNDEMRTIKRGTRQLKWMCAALLVLTIVLLLGTYDLLGNFPENP